MKDPLEQVALLQKKLKDSDESYSRLAFNTKRTMEFLAQQDTLTGRRVQQAMKEVLKARREHLLVLLRFDVSDKQGVEDAHNLYDAAIDAYVISKRLAGASNDDISAIFKEEAVLLGLGTKQ